MTVHVLVHCIFLNSNSSLYVNDIFHVAVAVDEVIVHLNLTSMNNNLLQGLK